MRFKSFFQFVSEGARWNSDRSGVIISTDNRPDDLFLTTDSDYKTKTGGFGGYIFKIYYGLVSNVKAPNLKGTDKEYTYSDLMQRLKQGYFNMVSAKEPDHKMSIKDISKGAQPDMTEYDQRLFYEFMKKTGKISDNLKYVVVAESNDIMTTLMAQTISKYTGAEIVELKKASYNDSRILDFYRELPKMEVDKTKTLSIFQKKILNDYTKYVESSKEGREKIERGELETEEDILRELGVNISGAPFLRNVFSRMRREGQVVIKGNTLFNHVRDYLNSKYSFDENFIEKVKECVSYGSTSKMLIVDDNIQHGQDFREIMNMCGYVVDTLQVAGTSTIEAIKKTEEIKKKLYTAINPTQKKKFEELYKQAQIMEKTNIDNITGYVLYERPVIASSGALDTRDWTSPLA
jgi:hypothetical protein